MNINTATQWLENHALNNSSGMCAKHVRLALESAGVDTTGHPVDAKDYPDFLVKLGATEFLLNLWQPKNGDIAVFESNIAHPYGHICMLCADTDGTASWISDFRQHHRNPYVFPASAGTLRLFRFQ